MSGWTARSGLLALYACTVVALVRKYRRPSVRGRATRFLRNRVAVGVGLAVAGVMASLAAVDGPPLAALPVGLLWFLLVGPLVDAVRPPSSPRVG